MWARVRRKENGILKDDYKCRDTRFSLAGKTKQELASLAKANPNVIYLTRRYKIVAEAIINYKDETGKSKQRTKFLASIPEADMASKRAGRYLRIERFWKTIDSKLAELSVTPEDEKKLRERINQMVKRPTKEELAEDWKRISAGE